MKKNRKIRALTIRRNGALGALAHRQKIIEPMNEISLREVDAQSELAREAAELETQIAYLQTKDSK